MNVIGSKTTLDPIDIHCMHKKKKTRKKVIQVWNHMKEEKKVQVYLTNKLVYIATWPTL